MTTPNYFKKLSKMVVGNMPVPQLIADKITLYHTEPMNIVRYKLGLPVYASEESGYRPYIWEIARGRSGGSQHTFGEKKDGSIDPKDKGAVDWTCEDFEDNVDLFLALIIENTEYTRIAIYDGFLHCDYKATDGKRYIFTSNAASEWELIKTID